MTNQPLIELRGVTKVYGDRSALDNVSVQFFSGQFVGVVGPSGSGKSTLARILVGLTRPTAGEIWHQGRRFDGRADIMRLAGRRQIVFQNPVRSLSPRLTVAEIVSEPAQLTGLTVDPGALLDRVGLSRDMLDRRPRRLSAGECQRVAIARALSTEPELLVLDEPDSALDPIAAAGIARLIKAGAGSRCIVVISHNSLVLRAAERILAFNKGVCAETSTFSVFPL